MSLDISRNNNRSRSHTHTHTHTRLIDKIKIKKKNGLKFYIFLFLLTTILKVISFGFDNTNISRFAWEWTGINNTYKNSILATAKYQSINNVFKIMMWHIYNIWHLYINIYTPFSKHTRHWGMEHRPEKWFHDARLTIYNIQRTSFHNT